MKKEKKEKTPKNAFHCKGIHLYEFGVNVWSGDSLNDYTVEYDKKRLRYNIYDSERNYAGSFSTTEYQQFESFVRSFQNK